MVTKAIPDSSMKRRVIVYGAFKGMGDLLSAAPVIESELRQGAEIKLLVFPKTPLPKITELLDFGTNRDNLRLFELPISGGLRPFLRQMKNFRADLIWISPHASREASSWKIPLLLWITKRLCWPQAKLAGAADESFSALFDVKVSADRRLPLGLREWQAYGLLSSLAPPAFPGFTPFIETIRAQRKLAPAYDLLIAPGANAKNRLWPTSHYVSLVEILPPSYRIAVVGVPSDVEQLRSVLPKSRSIEFLCGTLEQAISCIARARSLLSMDSGAMHFANVLNVPAIALFGKADPTTIIPADGSVLPVYERKFPCQPCEQATCSQPEVYCMNSLSPETVGSAILKLLQSTKPELAAR
jgi:heptosyltransferase-2